MSEKTARCKRTVSKGIVEALQSLGNFTEFDNHRYADGMDLLCLTVIEKVLGRHMILRRRG